MLELTEEEKRILYEEKYDCMSLDEIEKRIRLHDDQCEKILKELKRRTMRKKYYSKFKK